METKTRYTMVNKRGEEIIHSDSFLGFAGSILLIQLMACILFVIIAAICCGIGAIFS